MNVLLGADPEFFLVQGRSYIPAPGIVPGTKENPYPVKGGALQVDGVAVEVNVNPSASPDEFEENFTSVMQELKHYTKGFELSARPSYIFPQRVWKDVPKEYKELGCDPDFNAYEDVVFWQERTARQRASLLRNTPSLRTTGGHVHFGWGQDFDITSSSHIIACEIVIKLMETLTYPYIRLYQGNSLSVSRRMAMYGDYGSYRPKSYGVEWRTPSSAWLRRPQERHLLLTMWYELMLKLVSNEISPTCIAELISFTKYNPRLYDWGNLLSSSSINKLSRYKSLRDFELQANSRWRIDV